MKLNKNSYIKPAKPKFKVGDKVRIITDHPLKGTVVTIVDIGDSKPERYIVEREERDSKGDIYYIRCAPWYDHELELVEEDSKEIFTKADLKPGMVVEYRNGEKALYINGIFMEFNTWMNVTDFKEDLTYLHTKCDHYLDICKVYNSKAFTFKNLLDSDNMELIWERKDEAKEMTVAEIEEKLGYKVKIVDGE